MDVSIFQTSELKKFQTSAEVAHIEPNLDGSQNFLFNPSEFSSTNQHTLNESSVLKKQGLLSDLRVLNKLILDIQQTKDYSNSEVFFQQPEYISSYQDNHVSSYFNSLSSLPFDASQNIFHQSGREMTKSKSYVAGSKRKASDDIFSSYNYSSFPLGTKCFSKPSTSDQSAFYSYLNDQSLPKMQTEVFPTITDLLRESSNHSYTSQQPPQLKSSQTNYQIQNDLFNSEFFLNNTAPHQYNNVPIKSMSSADCLFQDLGFNNITHQQNSGNIFPTSEYVFEKHQPSNYVGILGNSALDSFPFPQDDSHMNHKNNIMNSGLQQYMNPTPYQTKIDRRYSLDNVIGNNYIPRVPNIPGVTASPKLSNRRLSAPELMSNSKDINLIPRRQKLRFPDDLYTPTWVRNTGQLKEGFCDTCSPGKWMQLKNSAYWYHKQFLHGVSSISGQPFTRPLKINQIDNDTFEGLCHQCMKWIVVATAKRQNSVLWYRHAHKCHVYTKPKVGKLELTNENKREMDEHIEPSNHNEKRIRESLGLIDNNNQGSLGILDSDILNSFESDTRKSIESNPIHETENKGLNISEVAGQISVFPPLSEYSLLESFQKENKMSRTSTQVGENIVQGGDNELCGEKGMGDDSYKSEYLNINDPYLSFEYVCRQTADIVGEYNMFNSGLNGCRDIKSEADFGGSHKSETGNSCNSTQGANSI
ncbi:Meiotic expression up-regulated protein 26 [Smittium mucronatum]|uniref:Meiotic expression up-regulated protein 26 n=1 Tax=Smittium mucronatum TaxID=133383 RepID=A0A1R0GVL3_9FUNG|nr:Meiotic expression up-regulated protein 26 [Smittium mucronatum]